MSREASTDSCCSWRAWSRNIIRIIGYAYAIVAIMIGFSQIIFVEWCYAQSCSAHYCVRKSTLNAGGQLMTSPDYRLNSSMGQESIIGTSSSSSFIIRSGFWSGTGSTIMLELFNIEKPVVDDSLSPLKNGVIEPNEYVNLIGTLENIGAAKAFTISGKLTTSNPIIINKPNAYYPDISPGDHESCYICYELMAPLVNRPSTHWDFEVIENIRANQYGPVSHTYIYHVGSSFADVPVTDLFYISVEKLLHAGIASGCSTAHYCPLMSVSRGQAAKLLCNSMQKSANGSCAINPCTGIFGDVPQSNIFCPYIEALYNAGVISGCQSSPLLYCPSTVMRRQEWAKLLCLGMQKASPGSCLLSTCGGIFNDVPMSNAFCPYIEALYQAGILSGCQSNPALFCPVNNVLRNQTAKLLVNAFGFSL